MDGPFQLRCLSAIPAEQSLGAALPGSSSTQPGGANGCSWQQRLLSNDGLNSIVVAEVGLLRSYHSGKHTWKRFKQIWTQKAEQNIRYETTPIRKKSGNASSLDKYWACSHVLCTEAYRGGMACLPASLAKDIGKTEGLGFGCQWKLQRRMIIYTTNNLLGAEVLQTHLSFGTVMTQAKTLWNCTRYSHVLTGMLS